MCALELMFLINLRTLITDRLSTHSLTQSVNCHEESWVGHSAIGPELQYIHIKPLKNPDILRTDTIGIKNFTQIPSLFSLKISFVLFLHVSKS